MAGQVRQRLARIAGRDLGAEQEVIEGQGARQDIRDRLNQALGRGKPDNQQKQQRELEDERKRQLELERQRERDRDLGWEL